MIGDLHQRLASLSPEKRMLVEMMRKTKRAGLGQKRTEDGDAQNSALQKLPFVFARWAVREELGQEIKDIVETALERSLLATRFNTFQIAKEQAQKRRLEPKGVAAYDTLVRGLVNGSGPRLRSSRPELLSKDA